MRPMIARVTLSRPALILWRPAVQYAFPRSRHLSTSAEAPATASLSPRWLSDVKARIGKCIMFGLDPAQTTEAGSILKEVALDWRDLVAGSEGFLTGKERRGLYRQEVVWGEMDSMGHVNNVMYTRYAESARCNWILHFAASDPTHRTEWMELITPKSIGLILRSIKTDYKFPMKWPDRITVLHKLRDRPMANTDHFMLDVLILSEVHRRPAARCLEDIVVYDYQKGRKSPLTPFMREKFEETFELQEQAKEKWGGRVQLLLGRVRQLEKGSWDKADAKEDFGSAGGV